MNSVIYTLLNVNTGDLTGQQAVSRLIQKEMGWRADRAKNSPDRRGYWLQIQDSTESEIVLPDGTRFLTLSWQSEIIYPDAYELHNIVYPNFYELRCVPLAWDVIRWFEQHFRFSTAVVDFNGWWAYSRELTAVPLADSQRMWLDKIAELILTEQRVKVSL